jgi:hypothetical protein
MPSLAPLLCRSARFPRSLIPSALQWRQCKKLSVALLLVSPLLPQTLISRHEESSQKPGPSNLWEWNILVFFLPKGADHLAFAMEYSHHLPQTLISHYEKYSQKSHEFYFIINMNIICIYLIFQIFK